MPRALYHFDRSKPFYPWVLHTLVGLWGLKELSAYGIGLLTHQMERPLPKMVEEALRDDPIANSRLTELMPALSLETTGRRRRVNVNISDIAEEFARNYTHVMQHTLRMSGTLLVVTYESTKQYSDYGELWEFFRHCRNAAAHGGVFNLTSREPRRPAIWQGLQITPQLHGTRLFKGYLAHHEGFMGMNEPIPDGFLRAGDPIGLLWDIERSTPTLPTS